MTPSETWEWIDTIGAINVTSATAEGAEEVEGIGEWEGALFEELTQGRSIIAHVHFDRGVSLSKDNESVRVYGCVFSGPAALGKFCGKQVQGDDYSMRVTCGQPLPCPIHGGEAS